MYVYMYTTTHTNTHIFVCVCVCVFQKHLAFNVFGEIMTTLQFYILLVLIFLEGLFLKSFPCDSLLSKLLYGECTKGPLYISRRKKI